jgi:hypothetical protein
MKDSIHGIIWSTTLGDCLKEKGKLRNPQSGYPVFGAKYETGAHLNFRLLVLLQKIRVF